MAKRIKKEATDRVTLKFNVTGVEFSGEDMRVVMFRDDHTIRTFDILSVKLVSSIIYLAVEETKGLVGKDLLGNHPLISDGKQWFNPEEGAKTHYDEDDSYETMANDMRVVGVVYQVLEAAKAGGMTKKRMTELYDEILGHYSELSPSGAQTLFTNLFSMMVQFPKDP